MDYGAIISLAGSAAKGIGSAQSAEAQKEGLTWDPVLFKPGKIGDAQQEFLQQGERLGDVSELVRRANTADNEALQKRYMETNPELAAGIGATDQAAADYAAGKIAPDVQLQLDRTAAERALQGGYAGSDMAGAQNLVDTMKYRLNLQTTLAPEMQAKAFNYANALNPNETNVASLLMDPASINKRNNQRLMYNNQIRNQQEQLNAKAKAESGNILFGTNTGGGGGSGMPSI
jgi:alkylated DNA nucleotide flippase Atl1